MNEITLAEHLANKTEAETLEMAARIHEGLASDFLAASPDLSAQEAGELAKAYLLSYLGTYRAAGRIRQEGVRA